MRNALLRAMHREEGYSLVISMLLMAIMMVLLAVSLDAGSSSLHQSSLSLQWSKALTVAEGGADAAVTTLGESRAATNSCAIGTSNVCNGVDGQYQVRWTTSGSQIVLVKYHCVQSPLRTFLRASGPSCAAMSVALSSTPRNQTLRLNFRSPTYAR